jgi:hypothetical protein
MCRDMLNIIQKTLIEKQGLHVFLTTHSPSTVPMAPNDSIYVMKAEGVRLAKTTKADALNLLTHGVPTLALNFDGRRQVITESADDAKICSALYEIFKKSGLRSDRSLEFLSIGSKSTKDSSDQNAGVDKALEVLEKFVAGGNQSVFALVDSDKSKRQSEPDKRIFVFGQGKRDGLENFVYDPLLLLVVLARLAPQQLEPAGLGKFTDTELSSYSIPDLQKLIDKLQDHIMGPAKATTKSTQIQYMKGFTLILRDDYLLCDDHDLENKVFEKFSSLKSNNERFSTLNIVNSCLAAHPDFIPMEFYRTFENILNADQHI